MKDNNGVMYSDLKQVQVIVAMMKKYKISDIVLSAGCRHIPLAHSVEQDPFFRCYSIVDERSAGFFALGLIRKLKKPVAICCTSATATNNYLPAVTEAYNNDEPLVVITADRNAYYLNQMEDQLIEQTEFFKGVTKKSVSLPIVENDLDFWYSERIVNEAFLELDHHGRGPVHINFPVEIVAAPFTVKKLPNVRKIERYEYPFNSKKWDSVKLYLEGKKILLIYGQTTISSMYTSQLIDDFSVKYDCFVAADHLSNLHSKRANNTFKVSNCLSMDSLNELQPDIVITMNANYVSEIKGWLKKNAGKFEHWLISEDGLIIDTYRSLTKIFQCSNEEFLKSFLDTKYMSRGGTLHYGKVA